MQRLTIKAMTLGSANGFMSELAGFPAELSKAEDGYLVEFELGHGDQEIIALLNALANYVTHRGEGPAEVGLAGRTYELHPAGSPVPA